MKNRLDMDRRTFLTSAAVLASSTLLGAGRASADGETIATVAGGRLRGVRFNGATSFKGVPYGDTTAGANRFRAPRPAPSWTGVRDAAGYGSLSPQIVSPPDGGPLDGWYDQVAEQGEDCLVLNIFTPDLDTTAGRPVMFYIHGGGYINGGGGGPGLDGTNLARFGDVVVVTINHRLNAFGYTNLSHIDAENFGNAANAGHLDIVAALEWVRDNIAAFGGDPGNVTLFGQSGGGSKIMSLLSMPAAQGLFHKAISMSGAAGLALDPAEDMIPYVDAFLAEAGVGPDNLAALREIPFEDLLRIRLRAVNASGLEGARPVLDGRHLLTLPMSPEGLPFHSHVPLLLGTTATEATLFFGNDMRNFSLTEAPMRKRLRTAYAIDDARVDEIVAAYRAASPEMTPSDILIAVASDVQFRQPLTRAAEIKSETEGQAPVWMYNFAWTIPADGGVMGAPHAIDIPFAFGTVDEAGRVTGGGEAPWETALNMMSAFVAFARDGDPNNARMPEWGPYNTETRVTMQINAECEATEDYRGAAREAVTGLRIDPFNRAALYRYEE